MKYESRSGQSKNSRVNIAKRVRASRAMTRLPLTCFWGLLLCRFQEEPIATKSESRMEREREREEDGGEGSRVYYETCEMRRERRKKKEEKDAPLRQLTKYLIKYLPESFGGGGKGGEGKRGFSMLRKQLLAYQIERHRTRPRQKRIWR